MKFKKWQKVTLIIAIIAVIAIVIVAIIINNKKEYVKVDGTNYEVNEDFEYLAEEDSTELANSSLYTTQYNDWVNIKNEYKKGSYNLDNPLIKLNPFEISPLTALVIFKTDKKEKVTITIKGDVPLTTTFEATKDHYIPIYGLYPNKKNEIEIKTASGKTNTIYIETEDPGEYVKGVVTTNNLSSESKTEFFFTTSSMGASNAAYDTNGELRWFLTRGYGKGMTFLKNGHMLISTDDPGYNSTSTSGVVEIDMLGFVYHEYVVAGGYHHDAYEMENGNLIILTSNVDTDTIADYIVELDRKSGEVVKSWDLNEIISNIDSDISKYYAAWGWINSITYDKDTNSFIMSFRNMNSIVSMNYETKKINWILGDSKYWTDKFDEYLIKGVGDDFIYPMGQHSVNVTDEGYISIFNNGYNAHKEGDVTCASIKDNESYATIYNIDTVNKTAKIVWKYGGNKYFSYALSSFTKGTNNHMIFSSGWHFTDETPFDSDECTQYTANTYESYFIEFDENKNILFEMQIEEGKFEVLKANIYNLESISVVPTTKTEVANYSVNPVVISTTVEHTFTKLSLEDAKKYQSAEKLDYALYADKNQVYANGMFLNSDAVNIVFIDLTGNAYKFPVKKSGSDQVILADGNLLPEGLYYIFVEINDEVYNSMQHVIIK